MIEASDDINYPISNNNNCPECGDTIFRYVRVVVGRSVDTLVECSSCKTVYIIDREERD